MRSYALCAALSERFRVVLLCGGALPEGIRPPAGVEIVALPALGVGPSGGFVSHDPRYTLEQAWAERSERILATFRRIRPAAVLVELFPFGRAKFARELVPLLEAARAAGARTACSVRDILVSSRRNQQRFDDRAGALADAHLDTVLVHSDPRFARLEETFSPATPLQVPVRYTGFVVRDTRRASPVRPAHAGRPVVVSAGGGLVGEPLLQRGGRRAAQPGRRDAADRGSAAARARVGAPADAGTRSPRHRVAAIRSRSRRRAGRCGRVGEPRRLQHGARGGALARARAGRPLRDRGGGRADAPRPAPRAPRGTARARAGAAGPRRAGDRDRAAAEIRTPAGRDRPRRRARERAHPVGAHALEATAA